MLKKTFFTNKIILIVNIVMIIAVLAVYWQVNQCGFVFDDFIYVINNTNIKSGFTTDSVRWAFFTRYVDLWNPLVWLSFMADYELYGLHAGGYHVTNLILHILSTLLLFWLFYRMTGALWKSVFVAAFFALHPLHVESVAWISERKDVLSTFFWMLTLCFYVIYTEKQSVKRYLLVVFSFVLALLSKPMVVTLPVVMILLDYWPLKRFENQNSLSDTIAWQIKEKLPLMVLSLLLVVVTFYTPGNNASSELLPLQARLANAPVAFVTYLVKTFWPQNMSIFYPFPSHIPVWQTAGALLLIIAMTAFVLVALKRLPYLFVGWFWFMIIISPVIGIIQISQHPYAMADRYHYLPSIGISVMLAWGMPILIKNISTRRTILFPIGVVFFTIMAFLSWKQSNYWQNSFTLFNHALQITKNNYMAHHHVGFALLNEGKYEESINQFDRAIQLNPHDLNSYNNRGNAYIKLGQHKLAIQDYNKIIMIKPNYAAAYINRGNAYNELGLYPQAIEDYNKAILFKPDYVEATYNNRGGVYHKLGQYQKAIDDFGEAIRFNASYKLAYLNRGTIYSELGQHERAIEDFSKAISLKTDDIEAYIKRALSYEKIGQFKLAVNDYNEGIRLNPRDPSFFFNRGAVYIKLGQYETAIKDFNICINLKPDYPDAYNNRAFIHLSLGQHQKAIDDYSQAIRLKPDYADAFNNRGFVHLLTGNMESGCQDAKKACNLGTCATMQLANGKGLCH